MFKLWGRFESELAEAKLEKLLDDMELPLSDELAEMELAGVLVDGDTLREFWQKLSASGTTAVPLEKQMWGDEFGMCVDGFGVPWMVNISQPQS